MHCAVLSQEEDKLRGFALTIIRTLLVPNVSLPDPYKNGTILKSVSDATEKNMASFFWHRWVREHLSLLQKQHKEKQVGNIVYIVDFNAPRSSWRIAVVHEARTSASGKSENRDKYLGSPC